MNVASSVERSPWATAWAEEAPIWTYIGKTLIAMYLTAWLAMRLEMPSPSTAMITVLIVMNRQAGLVLAKAFYRGLGTLLGCAAGVAMVALFPQQPMLLLTVMALWTGTMAAGAMRNRNLRAYTFVLAGYTVAMIVLPSVNNPASVFDTAVWRVAEVLLGLMVASCVFDIAWPSRLHGTLHRMARDNGQQLLSWLVRVGEGGVDAAGLARTHRDLGARAVAFEDLRSTAFFDDPSLRTGDAAIRQLNQRYLAVLSQLQLLHTVWRRQPDAAGLSTVMASLADALRRVSMDDPQLVEHVRRWERHASAAVSADVMVQHRVATFSATLQGYLQLVHQFDVDGSHRLPAQMRRLPPAFVRNTDPVAVRLTFVRAAVLMWVMGWLWMASGWNYGSTALFGIVALLSMLSAAPDPVAVAKQVSLGHLLAPVIALGCYSLLPILPTFPLLVLGTLPFLLLILRIGAHPPLAPLGMALNMGVMVAMSIGLAPKVNPQFYLNDALAISVGAGLALLAFIAIPNVTGSRGQRRRLLRRLRGQVQVAARAPLPGLMARMDSRSHDLLRQIAALLPVESVAARRLDDWMLHVHEASMAVIALRQWMAGSSSLRAPQRRLLTDALESVSAMYAHPRRAQLNQVTRCVQQAQQALVDVEDSLLPGQWLQQLLDGLTAGHRALRWVGVEKEVSGAA